MGRIRKIDINDGKRTLLYEDFLKVRKAKIGDIIVLSDGYKYEVVDNVMRFGKRIGREYLS